MFIEQRSNKRLPAKSKRGFDFAGLSISESLVYLGFESFCCANFGKGGAG